MLDLSSFDEAVMAEYLSFIKNLVSAHTFYLGACVKMIVDNFRPSMHKCQTLLAFAYFVVIGFLLC